MAMVMVMPMAMGSLLLGSVLVVLVLVLSVRLDGGIMYDKVCRCESMAFIKSTR